MGGVGAADTTGLWVRNGWLLAATERGWSPVKPPNPLEGLLPPLLEVPLYPRVPGADEKVGVDDVADWKGGGGPAAGGGRGGREAWSGGVKEEEDVGGCLRPGGGGYDMMNGCATRPWI